MKQLTAEQRKFLEYVKYNHNCIGWGGTIELILETNEYSLTGEFSPNDVVRDFRNLLKGIDEHTYGKPTKYLNG